jgi:hypothetical protein
MSAAKAERNRAIVLAYVSHMNAGRFEALGDLFAPEAEIVGVTGAGPLGYALPVWQQLHSGLAMHLDVQSMIAEGDLVGVRFRETGRWIGPFLHHTEPTGRAYELVAFEWFEHRADDGLILRRWGARDSAAQARQVGFPS